jgi:hypothetical protein
MREYTNILFGWPPMDLPLSTNPDRLQPRTFEVYLWLAISQKRMWGLNLPVH